MYKKLLTILAVIVIAVGCADSGTNPEPAFESTPDILPEGTPEPTDSPGREDIDESADGISIAGAWEYDDEGNPRELSETRLVISAEDIFIWHLYYSTASGTIITSDHEPARWISEATFLGAEDDPDYIETQTISIFYNDDTDRLTITIDGNDFSYLYRRANPDLFEISAGQDVSLDYNDYGIDYEKTSMDFHEFPLDKLAAYYLGGDGAYSYGASYEIIYRFIANPDRMLEFIALVGNRTVRGEPAKLLLCDAIVSGNFFADYLTPDSFRALLDRLYETYKLRSDETAEILTILRMQFEEHEREFYNR